MNVILVRHAIAEDAKPGQSDAARRLTEEGIEKFRRSAAGIANAHERPDAILTSPYRRAVETAAILSQAWGGPKPVETEALAWGRFEDLAAAVKRLRQAQSVALVGHEPHMSAVLAVLLGGSEAGPYTFKKGGAAIVSLDRFAPGLGNLIAFLPPRLSREMAGA